MFLSSFEIIYHILYCIMKITIAQINTKVWDIKHNENKIINTIKDVWNHTDIICFPELTTTWYPPNDLLEDEEFVRDQKQIIYKVREKVQQTNRDLKVILWFVDYDETKQVPNWALKKYNAWAIIWYDIKTYYKKLLPNYDIFFEKRYFSKWKDETYFKFANDILWTLTICEDIWDENYRNKPIQEITNQNVNTVFNISSSPFVIWKQQIRYELLQNHYRNKLANYIYTNQVWAQDEVVFDWSSLVFNNIWSLIHIWKAFEEDIQTIDMSESIYDKTDELYELSKDKYWNVIKAMWLGISDYLNKSWIKNVVIWISGWIDSAISAYILSQNVPAENIYAIYMPSKHSNSLDYAKALCNNLGIKLIVWEIDGLVSSFQDYSKQNLWDELRWISYENIQARIRWSILMSIANNVNWLVINNSNKTELALGYWTMYGDLIGWLSLLWDLNKKEVYELARYINTYDSNRPIPSQIITRPASAELSENQVDPFDYMKISDAIDEMLWWESNKNIESKYGLSQNEISKFKRLIKINEYKRRQSPPVLKLKKRSIWIWRIMPIV